MLMRATEFLKSPEKAADAPLVVIYGESLFLRSESLRALIEQVLGADRDAALVSRFPGDVAKPADVLDEVRTLPFLQPKRLVAVENAEAFITAHRKTLETYADKPSPCGVLVLMPKTFVATTRLAKLVEQRGLAIDCKSPSRNELPGWLGKYAASRIKCKFEPDACALLVELVGDDLGLLVSELEKLAVYAAFARPVTREDVLRLVESGRVESIWRILDLAAGGESAKALSDLDALILSGEEPVKMVAAMAASLRKVYHAGRLRRAGVDPREACRLAEIPPFAVDKTLSQHRHLGRERVDRLPSLLLQADRDIKGASQLSPRVILERMVIELAMAASAR